MVGRKKVKSESSDENESKGERVESRSKESALERHREGDKWRSSGSVQEHKVAQCVRLGQKTRQEKGHLNRRLQHFDSSSSLAPVHCALSCPVAKKAGMYEVEGEYSSSKSAQSTASTLVHTGRQAGSVCQCQLADKKRSVYVRAEASLATKGTHQHHYLKIGCQCVVVVVQSTPSQLTSNLDREMAVGVMS